MVMETRSAKRKKLGNRFDNLPDGILHEILRFLPIKSAAQTVVLSRRWEKVFCSIPDLDFTTLTSSPDNTDITINHVLENRDQNTSIRTLKLVSELTSISICSLLGYAKWYKVQELHLLLPTQLDRLGFSWKQLMENESLKVLWLGSLHLTVDLNRYWVISGAFKSLQSMTLSNICFLTPNDTHVLSDSMFPCLKKLTLVWCIHYAPLNISCSRLTDLVLKQCYCLTAMYVFGLKLERITVDTSFHNDIVTGKINIIAPVLKYLKWVSNHVRHIPVFENSSLLEKAVIGSMYPIENINDYINGPEYYTWRESLFNVIIALSHVKTLKLRHPFTDLLSCYDLKSIYVNKFESLRKLEICCEVSQFSPSNIRGVTAVLKHTPYIDSLVIKINEVHEYLLDTNDDINWEDEIPEIISFLTHLKTVKFVGFLEYVKELCSFVKFLLEQGKVLESITLYLGRCNSRQTHRRRIKSIMTLPWASSKVTVF